MGLGLLAACLPTLRFLFKGMDPDTLMKSLRGVFSLHSLRSQGSRIHDDSIHPSENCERNAPYFTHTETMIPTKDRRSDTEEYRMDIVTR